MNTTLPTFENYARPGSNYGAHTLRFFDSEGRCYWFSYQTLVALNVPGKGKIVTENDWGPTTGKHLNIIDGGDKAFRLPRDKFEATVAEWLAA